MQLAGVVVPSRGRVRTPGRVAYLPQLARDLPAVPAGRLSALLRGPDGPDDDRLVGHLATRADELSAGTARRLLLDAVLAWPAGVVVLDEPVDGLDDAAVRRLTGVLADRLGAGGDGAPAAHPAVP